MTNVLQPYSTKVELEAIENGQSLQVELQNIANIDQSMSERMGETSGLEDYYLRKLRISCIIDGMSHRCILETWSPISKVAVLSFGSPTEVAGRHHVSFFVINLMSGPQNILIHPYIDNIDTSIARRMIVDQLLLEGVRV